MSKKEDQPEGARDRDNAPLKDSFPFQYHLSPPLDRPKSREAD